MMSICLSLIDTFLYLLEIMYMVMLRRILFREQGEFSPDVCFVQEKLIYKKEKPGISNTNVQFST